jgi:hypothetical protein
MERSLLADELFFEDNAVPGVADQTAGHKGIENGAGLHGFGSHDDALAGGEAVSFEDDRPAPAAERLQGG